MANSEHLKILKQGVEVWNRWREEKREILPDLSEKDLEGSEFQRIDLRCANLYQTNLSGSDLIGARMYRVNLGRARLRDTDLTAADLGAADLGSANLKGARLIGANLGGANLNKADLTDADIVGAQLIETAFGDTRLESVSGLERCFFRGPCTIDLRTIEKSWPLPEIFLRDCGLPDHYIEVLPSILSRAIAFYSCFISYSHSDKPLARRLHDQLQARGIRCWLDEHDMKPGDRILDVVNEAIRLHDKILLCCSEASLTSWWVKDEIRKAQERERRDDRDIIIPLMVDRYLLDGWEDGLAADLRSRLAADFTGWEHDNAKFEEQFERVVRALRTDKEAGGAREGAGGKVAGP